MSTDELIEDFFRREYGRMVATLSRRVGVENLELVEDAVQSALLTAYDRWTVSETPDNPSAWIFRVAYNSVLDELRGRSRRQRILARDAAQTPRDESPDVFLESEVSDDLLRMLFVCCHEAIPEPSKLVFALKVLCGFNVREIAHRLFISEANVYKRVSRARARLRRELMPDELTSELCGPRVPSVHRVLYLMFTEGYLALRGEAAIRMELCREAIRLAEVLAEHAVGNSPETAALLALMHLHVARMPGRQAPSGGLLLLAEQDRSTWNQDHIARGMQWLAHSAQGAAFSQYHAEAGVAAEHCLAPSFEETRWERIAECYRILESMAPSPIHVLNRAVAVAEWKGPEAGLAVLDGFDPPDWLARTHLWWAVLAHLNRMAGRTDEAERLTMLALDAAPSAAVRDLLARRHEHPRSPSSQD